MQGVGLLEPAQSSDASEDIICVVDLEGLKKAYSARRNKVVWWSLR